jgi:hypothetical protein
MLNLVMCDAGDLDLMKRIIDPVKKSSNLEKVFYYIILSEENTKHHNLESHMFV